MNNYEEHIPVIVLVALAILGGFVLWKAQQRTDFDWGNMLKDENGKESAVRMGILVSLSVSTWWVVWMALHKVLGIYEQLLYLGTWSGVALAAKLIDKFPDRK